MFTIKKRDQYIKTRWHDVAERPTKLEAEREALRLVHEGLANAVIVTEMQPVVVSKVARTDGAVTLTYPGRIQDEAYE